MTSSKPAPKVSIIIPTLHLQRPKNPKYLLSRRYTLQEVLHDLKSNIELPIEVIVICNGTDPALRNFVQGHARIDKYAINSVNVGVARAWNMGAMMAEGEALCFLNDDVEVGARGIDRLYEVLMSDPTIGEVGPRGSVWRGAEHERYVGEHEPEDASNISGFCFMVRAELFHRVAGFDIAYTPAGFEEIDFSFAIRQLGFRCRVVPKLPIIHHYRHGVSAAKCEVQYFNKTTDTRTLHLRNKAYFEKKWKIPE